MGGIYWLVNRRMRLAAQAADLSPGGGGPDPATEETKEEGGEDD